MCALYLNSVKLTDSRQCVLTCPSGFVLIYFSWKRSKALSLMVQLSKLPETFLPLNACKDWAEKILGWSQSLTKTQLWAPVSLINAGGWFPLSTLLIKRIQNGLQGSTGSKATEPPPHPPPLNEEGNSDSKLLLYRLVFNFFLGSEMYYLVSYVILTKY